MPRPRPGGCQQRPRTDHVVGQGAQPLPQGAVLATLPQTWQGKLDKVRGAFGIAGSDRMSESIGQRPVLGVPLAGGPMQTGHPVRVLGQEPGPQSVAE